MSIRDTTDAINHGTATWTLLFSDASSGNCLALRGQQNTSEAFG
jgi:hypothetical protein